MSGVQQDKNMNEQLDILTRENRALQRRITTLEMKLAQCNTENRNVHDKVAKMQVLINWLKK